jgi:hypothetical protein
VQVIQGRLCHCMLWFCFCRHLPGPAPAQRQAAVVNRHNKPAGRLDCQLRAGESAQQTVSTTQRRPATCCSHTIKPSQLQPMLIFCSAHHLSPQRRLWPSHYATS